MKKVIPFLVLIIICLFSGCEVQNTAVQNDGPAVVEYDEEVFDIVDERHRAEVARTFMPGAQKITLDNDLHVYRYWGGGSGESGYYFSRKMYTESDVAKRELALPDRNTAANVTQYKIPAGTTLIYGITANMADLEGFSIEAVGGAEQYYLPNPRVAQKELVGKLEYTSVKQGVDELEEVEAISVQ